MIIHFYPGAQYGPSYIHNKQDWKVFQPHSCAIWITKLLKSCRPNEPSTDPQWTQNWLYNQCYGSYSIGAMLWQQQQLLSPFYYKTGTMGRIGSTSYVLPIRLSYRTLNRVIRVPPSVYIFYGIMVCKKSIFLTTYLITLLSVRYDSRIGST